MAPGDGAQEYKEEFTVLHGGRSLYEYATWVTHADVPGVGSCSGYGDTVCQSVECLRRDIDECTRLFAARAHAGSLVSRLGLPQPPRPP